jgi:hypothetical protein
VKEEGKEFTRKGEHHHPVHAELAAKAEIARKVTDAHLVRTTLIT